MKQEIEPNFIYPEIKESDRKFGAGITGDIIREDGNWRDYLPPVEDQNVRGIESSACYIEGQQHSIATIQEEEFSLPDQNYSSRFSALLSGGTQVGGDPIAGAKSIKYDGLIPDSKMPFGNDVTSWDDFHSWKGVDQSECKNLGKDFANTWDLNFKIAVEISYPLETKYIQLREALKRSPVPMSVVAWYERNGKYYKPEGLRDSHLVEAVYLNDKNEITIRDTYPPYEKVLEANTNFEFALYWVVKKKGLTTEQISLFQRIINAIKEALGLVQKQVDALPVKDIQKDTANVYNELKDSLKDKPSSLLKEFCLGIQEYEDYVPPGGTYRNGNLAPNGSISFINKNPGNIKAKSGKFLVFKTYEEGFNYLIGYVYRACTGKHAAYRPEMTINQFFHIYTGDKEPVPTSYAEFVAEKLMVNKDTFQIKQLLT